MCSTTAQCVPDPVPTPDPGGGGGGAGPGGGVPGYSPPPNWCDTDGDGTTNCACGAEIPDPNPDNLSCEAICDQQGGSTPCDSNCGVANDTCVNNAGGSSSILAICAANYAECLNSCDRTTCCAVLDEDGCENNNPDEAPGTGCTLGSGEGGTCTQITDNGGTGCQYYVCTSESPSP